MATYRIISWKHIPGVIEADDGTDEVKLSMGERFEQLVDAVAMEQGVLNSDEFLSFWEYGEEMERPGTAQEVAEAVKKELEEKFA